jgi:uncharacterized protein (DUF2141 family)
MRTLILLFLLLLTVQNFASEITVNISGIKNNDGNILISLYDSEENFLNDNNVFKSISVPAQKNVSASFSNINSGTYAVGAIHDEDENGKLKQWFWVGPPKEGVAASGNSESIPTFNSAKFYVDTAIVVDLEMKYLGNGK